MIVRDGSSGVPEWLEFLRTLALCLLWDRLVKSLRKGVDVGSNDDCMV